MPFYDYVCNKCNHKFELSLRMAEVDTPCEKACPNCKKKNCISQDLRVVDSNGRVRLPGVSVDNTLTPDTVTGGQFSQVMNKIKKGIPKRYHENLDRAASRTGRSRRTGK